MENTFGRFDVLRSLGRGGMSWTCLVEVHGPRGFRKRMALKRLHAALLDQPEVRALFDTEARICGALEHNNIVRAYEYGDVGDEPYIAFELVEGMTLRHLLRGLATDDRKVPVGFVCHLGRSLATALDYAHRKGIVHRDVCSANVLLSWNGEIKLADFGVARHTAESLAREAPAAVHGRFAYMAPEQADGAEPAPRADLFSLGALLYECLTGRRPFPGVTSVDELRAAHGRGRPPLRALRPQTPVFLAEVIASCLARDPEDRPQTAAEVARHLQAVARRINEPADDLAVHDLLGALQHRWGRASGMDAGAPSSLGPPLVEPPSKPSVDGTSVPGARLAVLNATVPLDKRS